MEKKEYVRPDIFIVEMLENTSILAGSASDIITDPTLEEGDDGNGFGNDEGTDVWE